MLELKMITSHQGIKNGYESKERIWRKDIKRIVNLQNPYFLDTLHSINVRDKIILTIVLICC